MKDKEFNGILNEAIAVTKRSYNNFFFGVLETAKDGEVWSLLSSKQRKLVEQTFMPSKIEQVKSKKTP